MILEIIGGRRKLIEKLHQLDDKLRPIKANWEKLSPQIAPEHKYQAHKITSEVHEIIAEIQETTPLETMEHLPLAQHLKFNEPFAEIKSQHKD